VADDVLVNDGPIDLVAPRVARLHAHYCALAAQSGKAVQAL
jgi:hypothetical protein